MSDSIYQRLQQLSIELASPTTPAVPPAYVPCVQTGSLVFVSGHIAQKEGKPWVGQLGINVSVTEGQQAARAAAIDLLSTLHTALGDLSRIRRLVKVLSLVNSSPNFTQQHIVTNGASELFNQVFGPETGAHARSAFGVAQLPLGACIEIELVVEVAPAA